MWGPRCPVRYPPREGHTLLRFRRVGFFLWCHFFCIGPGWLGFSCACLGVGSACVLAKIVWVGRGGGRGVVGSLLGDKGVSRGTVGSTGGNGASGLLDDLSGRSGRGLLGIVSSRGTVGRVLGDPRTRTVVGLFNNGGK